MIGNLALTTPGPNPLDMLKANASAVGKLNPASASKAKVASQEFEAVFLNSMFQQMFTGIDGDGPFGGSGPAGTWRSMLTDEYAKTFAKAGGVGIADQVYRSMIAMQEAQS